MLALRIMSCVGLVLFSALEARAEIGPGVDRTDPLSGRVARWFSPELRRTEARLVAVAAELETLPSLLPQPFASRYGFRSEILSSRDVPQWVQIDLGRSVRIDRIVAMPVNVPIIGEQGRGYGFPLRFKIEVADDPGMETAQVVVDRTGADVMNPGRNPVDFRIPPVSGRYVRFTSTRHFPINEGFIWALEELVVLSGNLMAGVSAVSGSRSASNSLELFPNWSMHRFNDGQSALGIPATLESSPTRGYVSATTNDPLDEKWLSVDLGREEVIDEVRLVPVEPEGFESLGEKSHPRAWKVELAKDPAFEEVTWSYHMARTNLVGYPGRCSLVISCPGRPGRYVRLVAQDLWGTGENCGFGLSELQAYAGGRNVALGKTVLAKDAADKGVGAGWSPEFVVDGFSSKGRLIEWPEYLDLIGRRAALEREREDLAAWKERRVHVTGMVLGYGGSTLVIGALLGWGLLFLRQRTLRQRAVDQLRDQIARDLHDDIGSNLGGIVLLSEMGNRYSSDESAREDFAAIRAAAEETSKSMQDMVWLIGRGNMSLRALVIRMRQSAAQLLGENGFSWSLEPADPGDRELSLFFRRHVFFSFKETLNNIRRHAAATDVAIRVTIDARDLAFEVRDNGVGFDPDRVATAGHGLANLKRRAERLKGSHRLESRPGGGTRVELKAPLKS